MIISCSGSFMYEESRDEGNDSFYDGYFGLIMELSRSGSYNTILWFEPMIDLICVIDENL